MPRKSTIRVPEPTRLPSGRWRIQLQIDGRRLSVTEDDPKECQAKAIALKAGLIEQAAKPNRITLRAAIDKYIESRSAVLSPSTIRGYRAVQRSRFASIMDTQLDKLTRSALQRAVNEEAAHLSPKTLHNSYMFIAGVIHTEAGKRYDIALPKVTPHERPYLTPEQIKVFIAALHGTPIEIPSLLGLQSLRCSEIVGLRWCDVDLDTGTACIRHTRVYNKDGKLVGKDATKNATSARIVSLPDRLVELLKAADRTGEYICTMRPQTLWRGINRICRRNGLPEVGVHGLRHSFASLGYHLGVSDKAMQELGGWADTQTMRKIYTHISRADVALSRNAVTSFFDAAEQSGSTASRAVDHT